MSLKVIRLPFPATLQDLGRRGWLRYGVPRSGAFDCETFVAGNRCLGNEDGAPGIEVTLLGGLFEAQAVCTVSVAGAPSSVLVNGAEIGTCNRHAPILASLSPGDEFEICPAQIGLRAYLCASGGFVGTPVLGSVAGQPLIVGDSVSIADSPNTAYGCDFHITDSEDAFRLVPGPHSTDLDLITITSSTYTATNHSNRVGIRLDGPSLTPQADRPSEPACIGAIQISNSGQPIILGPDGPTIGGYPIVAVVKKIDQSRLGQLRPGDEVRFTLS